MLLAICTTQVKKEIKKERGGGGEPGSSKYVRTEKDRLYPQPRTQASSRYLSYTSEIAEDDWELLPTE